jgi:hypothetical protein
MKLFKRVLQVKYCKDTNNCLTKVIESLIVHLNIYIACRTLVVRRSYSFIRRFLSFFLLIQPQFAYFI